MFYVLQEETVDNGLSLYSLPYANVDKQACIDYAKSTGKECFVSADLDKVQDYAAANSR